MILRHLTPAELQRLALIVAGLVAFLYLLRERRRAVRVPYLRILEEALGKALPRSSGLWWRRLFSLLLQLAVLGTALLALGDPAWDGGLGLRHEPLKELPPPRLVVLLDASRSMARARRDLALCTPRPGLAPVGGCAWAPSGAAPSTFDEARAAAGWAVAVAPEATQVLVATLEGAVHTHLLWGTRSEALVALASLEAGDSADDPRAAGRWVAALGETNPGAEVRVYTDLQRKEAWARIAALSGRLVALGEPGGNLRIAAFRARADAGRPGRVRALCRVENLARSGAPAKVALEIASEELDPAAAPAVVAVRHLVVAPSRSESVELVLDSLGGPLLRASLQAEDPTQDVLPRDSRAWAEVPALEPLAVALRGEAAPEVVAALVADPWIELLPETTGAIPERARAVVYVGASPDALVRPSLILNPPVDPARPLAAVTSLKDARVEARAGRFWGALVPGSLELASARALVRLRGERAILRAGEAVVGTAGRVEGIRVVRLGLDPADPGLRTSVMLPALLARAVDRVVGRSELLGRTWAPGRMELGTADPVTWYQAPAAAPIAGFAASLWITRAGVLRLRRASGAREARVITLPADPAEDRATGSREPGRAPVLVAPAPVRRSTLWRGLLLTLLGAVFLERWLFVRRSVV